jgi:phage/plasmid-associated DNA primase
MAKTSSAQTPPANPFLTESGLTETITQDAAWTEIIFEQTRKRWMQYATEPPLVWRELADETIERRVFDAMRPLCPGGFSASKLAGVIKCLKILQGKTLTFPSRDYLPCRNVVLHVPSMTTKKHTPDLGFTWCLPYDYTPDATCPEIVQWLTEASSYDPATVQLLRAYLRAILLRRVKIETFLEIIGHGGSGKGTFTRLAQALVGFRNSFATNLKHLEQSRFETVNLIDKQLVIITDEERYTGSVTTLKAITGEDSLRGERKFESPFTFTNTCMVIIAANEAIQSPDYTSGLARRRLSVAFTHHPTHLRDLIHFDEAGEPHGELAEELPGLLTWVLEMKEEEMVSRLRNPTSSALVATRGQILIDTNPLAAWAQDALIHATADDKTYVGLARPLERGQGFEDEATHLYANYRAYMQRAGFKDVSLTRFSALLEDLCHDQLHLRHVVKHRDSQGVHLTGLRLRTDEHRTSGGFIDIAMASRLAVQDPVDSMKTSPPDNADYVDHVDSSIKEYLSPPGEQEKRYKEFSPNPALPTLSTLPRAQPYIQPSAPYTTRSHATSPPLTPRQTGSEAPNRCDCGHTLAQNQKVCFQCHRARKAATG